VREARPVRQPGQLVEVRLARQLLQALSNVPTSEEQAEKRERKLERTCLRQRGDRHRTSRHGPGTEPERPPFGG